MFTILFILYSSNKRGPYKGIILKGFFIPKRLNNSLASCFWINFDFLLPYAAHFDKSIIIPVFVLATY